MYALTRLTLGKQPKIEIDATRYAELTDAITIELVALDIEARFDLLVRNYEEFERELITLTLAQMVRGSPTESSMFAARRHLVRRLVNLLSTARLYIDQTMHAVSSSPVDLGCTKVQAKAEFSKQHDKSVGYRIMEALRNHIQHCSEPTNAISYPSQIEGREEDEPLWSFGLDLMLDMESLRRDKCFKKRVLREIESLQRTAEQRDLILFVRQYVEGLGHVQEQLRGLIQSAVDDADEAVDKAVTDWKNVGHGPGGCFAVKFLEDSTAEEPVYVSHGAKEKRAELVAENGSFANLSRRFVSSVRKRDAYPIFHSRS